MTTEGVGAMARQRPSFSTDFKVEAASLTIMTQMQGEGYEIGRFCVRRLIRELGPTCMQLGPHTYKKATVSVLIFPTISIVSLGQGHPIRCGVAILRMVWLRTGGITSRWCWTCLHAKSLAGLFHITRIVRW